MADLEALAEAIARAAVREGASGAVVVLIQPDGDAEDLCGRCRVQNFAQLEGACEIIMQMLEEIVPSLAPAPEVDDLRDRVSRIRAILAEGEGRCVPHDMPAAAGGLH